jgi:hypothetical protein
LIVTREWLEVIEEASQIELDPQVVLRWYVEDPIASLGGLTAAELVASGGSQQVIAFLRDILASADFFTL